MDITSAVQCRIFLVRGQRVMLDADLAELYGVATKTLNRAVYRNISRFPPDFMFQLDRREAEALRYQFGTSNKGRGGRTSPPLAFTEHGVAMLSSVLRSGRAVQVNIEIMRAFTQLRRMAAEHRDLLKRIARLEKRYDAKFRDVFCALRDLIEGPTLRPRRIGFKPPGGRSRSDP
ncbi:MAG: ORF6N domain-containing protein [Elusimicrobia bacterium]|nr:ORF6N domain-containing protein [Elusimicrobiota bacterium]